LSRRNKLQPAEFHLRGDQTLFHGGACLDR
jgi:hypothetical protein